MNGKVVVVTGASSGIGAALAEAVAAAGGRPVLAARREAELHAVASRCGAEALVVPADVRRREDVARILERALERFGRLDVWVNNAGRGISKPVSRLTDEDVDEMMSVNLKSALYGMQAVLPHFKERGTGQIVNVSSMLGRIPLAPMRSAYSAAKHALNALSGSLRGELAAEYPGIVVTTVSPGVVATEFGVSALGGGIDSRAIPGAQTAADVAAVILDAIRAPRADVYTRPQAKEQVAAYFAAEDMAAVEAASPFIAPRTP
ncbi:MAG TPA: SDR family NAD(P)-dependent oxidoreductase [Candidatus Eisenbacteria bacterium]|nr:SDR family NAD(P)-dependent oxidoreductase [Candidatus Eisenbacteria bacterium]